MTSAFFTSNEQFLLYRKTKIKTTFEYITYDPFDFLKVFQDCFDKPYRNFDDDSEIGYSRPS